MFVNSCCLATKSASGALPGGVAETCNQPLRLHWRARSVRVDKVCYSMN